jgi:hypothetical protein
MTVVSSRLLGGSVVFQMAVAQVKCYCVSVDTAIHCIDIKRPWNVYQRHLAIAVAQAM